MSDDSWRRNRKPSRGRRSDPEQGFPGDGGWSPPSMSDSGGYGAGRRDQTSGGTETSALVKRFDGSRGFGFVGLDGGGDAFLHISVLQRMGVDSVPIGARLRVRVGQGQKGPQVTEVLEIGEVEALPPERERSPSRGAPPPPSGPAQEMTGVVKWYNAQKGFGFVAPESGGPDVFVHASALERSGVRSLAEGQSITIRVVTGRKGPEAESVRVD